jgi:hypothetical protein
MEDAMEIILPIVSSVFSRYPHERKRHSRASEELGIHDEVDAGCFLTGHPQIREPVGAATLGFGEERVFLFGAGEKPLGSVSYVSIVSVSVESHTAVLARFSEARLMQLGHHLLAFRSRESADGSYVVVEWEDDEGHRHDGIFCFEGLAADARARCFRDAILHHATLHRYTGVVPIHSSFARLLDEFEARGCEHCGKIHRHTAQVRGRSAA